MGLKVTAKLASDWFGHLLEPPVHYSFELDENYLLFAASRRAKAEVMPDAGEGRFTPELWRFDVAELFLADPAGKTYLEINLAPNGAWWMCWFQGPRLTMKEQPHLTGVEADGKSEEKDWSARIRIPRHLLPPLETLTYNVTFILNSPAQTFHSLAPLPGEQPDFHQPESFLSLSEVLPS